MNRIMLVLSAGASSRMGEPKGLLVWKGRTLLEHALTRAEDAGFVPIAVLGFRAEELKGSIRGHESIHHLDWAQGIGSSIGCGVRHALREHQPDAIGVSLVDQPLVTPEHLRALGDGLSQDVECVATDYPGGAGVPAVFGLAAMEHLLLLNGQTGAKPILNGDLFRVKRIAFSDTLDIDEPAAWKKFLETYG